ncbi:hypothetical protein SERLA73DRAFT_184404 [Serpula lacrymans var. lacrymans S7.3]|uniref:Uncharacterized protein n=1 Tax=Serpula lacrymans var. lacrymans (strain S7.3) TaxID=936435 RepID=F8Q359_SERL3|nr:hypothetical protein SERLA73DRAFT_184404 [Serpula lacrymans var. lacrymans S7.3]
MSFIPGSRPLVLTLLLRVSWRIFRSGRRPSRLAHRLKPRQQGMLEMQRLQTHIDSNIRHFLVRFHCLRSERHYRKVMQMSLSANKQTLLDSNDSSTVDVASSFAASVHQF